MKKGGLRTVAGAGSSCPARLMVTLWLRHQRCILPLSHGSGPLRLRSMSTKGAFLLPPYMGKKMHLL